MAVDPPTDHHTLENGKSTVEGVIDPTLVDHAQATNAASASSIETEGAKLPDDEKVLKRTWLTLLPTEQVIEILLKLDECVVDGHAVKREVWPTDLKAAVFHAAVARIVESSGGSTTVAGGEATKGGAHEAIKSTPTAGDGKQDVTKGPSPPTTSISPTSTPGAAAHTPPVPSTTSVPPLTSTVPRASPPTSTTTYQAAASASTTSFSYPYAPYSSGSIPYNSHSSHHQPYSFSYSPSPSNSAPAPRVPPPPSPLAPLAEEEDDLPSYEEMLVQALTVHNDPRGTAPKQLFQWMAATYPLQANFRPSASQALQKAYKRGRFEKNSEGRYRLNPCWVGGNTSRRTTRRPQTYSKAVLNPSPSSHPPTNTSQYPPQHYKWTYGNRSGTKSQSPAPPTPSLAPTAASPVTGPATTPSVSGKQPLQTTVNAVGETDRDHESHRSCMDAAYSILQALNITSAGASGLLNTSSTDPAKDSSASTRDTAESGEPSVPTFSGASASSESPQPAPSSSTPTYPSTTTVQPNRAALQGSLALLAAQLAELADDAGNSGSHTNGTGQPTSSTGLTSLSFLEGMSINLNIDLAQLGLEVEPSK